jgi:hypothetical protein
VPEYIDFDGELVDIAIEGVEQWVDNRKMWGQRKAQQIDHKDKQGLRELRSHDARLDERPARSDKGRSGRGEGSKKEKEKAEG